MLALELAPAAEGGRSGAALQMCKLYHRVLGTTGATKSDEFSDKVQGGGSFPIQKIMLQICALILRENNYEFSGMDWGQQIFIREG